MPAPSTYDALQRTARLIDEQFFAGNADRAQIADALPQFQVTLTCDEANIAQINGQQLVIASCLLIARMGVNVNLNVPEINLEQAHPPLRGHRLKAGLIELGQDLIPGVAVGDKTMPASTVELVIGDSRRSGSEAGGTPTLAVTADDWTVSVVSADEGPGQRVAGSLPFGACAAAATAAAEVLRAVLPQLAELIDTPLKAEAHRLEIGQPIQLDLGQFFPTFDAAGLDLGRLDAISGGAINSSAIYVTQRCAASGDLRVVEDDLLEASNLNRYWFARQRELDLDKVDHLSSQATTGLSIDGQKLRYTEDSIGKIGALAGKVLVGVDHIPSRWLVQEQAPDWVGVGSTQALTALVSSHRPGQACARCQHPTPTSIDDEVATISFVSFWSGLLLAMELLSFSSDARPEMQTLYCQPFGYDGPLLMRTSLKRSDTCPVCSPTAAYPRRRPSLATSQATSAPTNGAKAM